MKEILAKLVIAIIIIVGFTACPIKPPDFDSKMLVGKWQSNTLFEKYHSDFTGTTWDTADDVFEDEAHPFDWELDGNTLTQIHKMEMGGVIPKTYTVTELTDSTFKYRDNYDKSYSFHKIN